MKNNIEDLTTENGIMETCIKLKWNQYIYLDSKIIKNMGIRKSKIETIKNVIF